ncbi:hypothetical protein ACOMHN_035851 [Nucella lapillus]
MSCYQESEDADCEVGCCSVVLESVQEVAGVEHTVCSSIQEFSGRLKLEAGKVNGTVCFVLRDTGATVCGVRKWLVCPDQYTGESIKCVSFGGRVDEFPLARVDVSSEYITGEIVCCVLEAPVADFIVGNISKDCEGVTVSAGLCLLKQLQPLLAPSVDTLLRKSLWLICLKFLRSLQMSWQRGKKMTSL